MNEEFFKRRKVRPWAADERFVARVMERVGKLSIRPTWVDLWFKWGWRWAVAGLVIVTGFQWWENLRETSGMTITEYAESIALADSEDLWGVEE